AGHEGFAARFDFERKGVVAGGRVGQRDGTHHFPRAAHYAPIARHLFERNAHRRGGSCRILYKEDAFAGPLSFENTAFDFGEFEDRLALAIHQLDEIETTDRPTDDVLQFRHLSLARFVELKLEQRATWIGLERQLTCAISIGI